MTDPTADFTPEQEEALAVIRAQFLHEAGLTAEEFAAYSAIIYRQVVN